MAILDEKLVQDLLSLPYNLRAELIDRLIRSMNVPIQEDINEIWSKEADKRVEEIESGIQNPVDGEKVFEEIRKRYRK